MKYVLLKNYKFKTSINFVKSVLTSVKYVYLPIDTYILSHRMSLDSKTATYNLFNLKQVT